MSNQEFTIHPMTAPLGAEIHGLDISEPLEDATAEKLRTAWVEYKVLFFREQELTPDQHKQFAHYFGEFQAPGFVPTLPDHPEVKRQEQPNKTNLSANIIWHTDDIFNDIPSNGSVLYALDVPERGGDTLWCDLEAAYEALSDTMKDLLSGLKARHVPLNDMRGMITAFGIDGFASSYKSITPSEHPVLKTHPVTGRTCLYVNEQNTVEIVGMTRSESDALLGFLFEHSQRPDFHCRFSWRKGSVAFWDNRCTMHRGLPNFMQAHRLMHRVAIAGTERPYYEPRA